MAATPHAKEVDTAGFQSEVVERSREVPVVVDFWAAWCGPCKVLDPLLEKTVVDGAGSFELVKVDVDANQGLAAQFGVQGIPTVIGFRDGQPVSRFTGAIPEAQLREWIRQIVPSEADRIVETARDLLLSGDTAGAEGSFREALRLEPTHQAAATGLAALLLGDDRSDEAQRVLEPLEATPEVDKLRAAARLGEGRRADPAELEARLAEDPDNAALRIELATALAAHGDHEIALEHLLQVVQAKGLAMDEARKAMLDIFEVLGADHPLAASFRRRLASALF